MSLTQTDVFVVQRGATKYKLTAAQMADFFGALKDVTATTIANRDAGTWEPQQDLSVGDRVFCADASGDATVDSGWAIYRVNSVGPYTFQKVQEQESLDVSVTANTNLSVTPSATGVTINSDTGDNANIPLSDGVNAGLMSPDQHNELHKAVTTSGDLTSNPITVDGNQVLGFDISGLLDLP